jgi:hypothetical protein
MKPTSFFNEKPIIVSPQLNFILNLINFYFKLNTNALREDLKILKSQEADANFALATIFAMKSYRLVSLIKRIELNIIKKNE